MASLTETQHMLGWQTGGFGRLVGDTYDLTRTRTLGKEFVQPKEEERALLTTANLVYGACQFNYPTDIPQNDAFDPVRSSSINSKSFPLSKVRPTKQPENNASRKRGLEEVMEVSCRKRQRLDESGSSSPTTSTSNLGLFPVETGPFYPLSESNALMSVEQDFDSWDTAADGTICDEILTLAHGFVDDSKGSTNPIPPAPQSHMPETRRTNFIGQPRSYNAQPWTHASTKFRKFDYGGGFQNIPTVNSAALAGPQPPSAYSASAAECPSTVPSDDPNPILSDQKVYKSRFKRPVPQRRPTTRSVSTARKVDHFSLDLTRKGHVHTSCSTESWSFKDALSLAQKDAVNLSDEDDDSFDNAIEHDLLGTFDELFGWEESVDSDMLDQWLQPNVDLSTVMATGFEDLFGY